MVHAYRELTIALMLARSQNRTAAVVIFDSVGGRLLPAARRLRSADVPRAHGALLHRLSDRPPLRRAGAVLVIRVEGLTKTFTAHNEIVAAVDGIDFEVGPGEVVTLLGPSGCGKTTTLRCVAGLERAQGGRIVIGDRTVVDVAAGVFVPPHRRNLGMVFQSYAIWPHMTVIENVAYALEGRGIEKAERKRLAMAALETVQARPPRRPAGAAALGRPAAARRDRARHGGTAAGAAVRRALEQSRRPPARRDAQRVAAHPAPDRTVLDLRHARSGRSAGGLRLDRGDEGRPHRRARPPARYLPLSAPRLHRAVPRHAPT